MAMNDYHNKFSTLQYLESHYTGPQQQKYHNFAVKQLHSFFSNLKGSSKSDPSIYKVLDFGCGPVVANIISAAGVVEEVVLAEYTEGNRKAIQDWLNNDPSAWNWKPFFDYVVVSLEGKSADEAVEREKRLRSIVKGVIPCDVTKDPPIALGYEGPYDIVMCLLSIETGCLTQEEYRAAVKRVSTLIKVDGFLLLYSTIRYDTSKPGWFKVGSETFMEISLSFEFVSATLRDANFEIISNDSMETPYIPSMDETCFIVAKKYS